MSLRKTIHGLLNSIYPTYPISTKKGEAKKPYLVLKFNEQNKSTLNELGGFIYFEVLCYIPGNSIDGLDDMVENVIRCLKDICEFTGECGVDFYDENVKAFMRSPEFRIAKTLDY